MNLKTYLKLFLCFLLFPIFSFAATIPSGFTVASWIPYWTQDQGIPALQQNLDKFNIITPFAYGVSASGALTDDLGIANGTWNQVLSNARAKGIKIVPSILWGSAAEIHNILFNPTTRATHEDQIVSTVTQNNFDGIEIDYEGKNISDKNIFSTFIEELSTKLHAQNKILVCTVEARSTDTPGADVPPNKLFPWVNDWTVLNNNCDQVRIMAYDEFLADYQSNSFMTTSPLSESVSNASLPYITSVLNYAKTVITPSKIILGIPTYGYEFTYTIVGNTRYVKRVNVLTYTNAISRSTLYHGTVGTTAGGEKFFLFSKSGIHYYVVFDDGQNILDRINLAKSEGVGGASIFEINGYEDPKMWNLIP